MVDKNQIIFDTQAIVSIVAGTASLLQEYESTVFTCCVCSKCFTSYWKLVANRETYLRLYPHCPKCGEQITVADVTADREVIGCEVVFLMKSNAAYASFKLTQKALETPNIKQMIQRCDAKFIQ